MPEKKNQQGETLRETSPVIKLQQLSQGTFADSERSCADTKEKPKFAHQH